MALQGSLKELKLGDVLQTVLAAGGKGLLRVRGPAYRVVLHLSTEGLQILEPEILDEKIVIESFVRRGSISAAVGERALGAGAASLDGLVAAGTLEASDVKRVLTEAAEEAVLEVLGWEEGAFRFDEGSHPDRSLGPVARIVLDPNGILLRAAQRIDELKSIQERIGPNAALLLAINGTTAIAAGLETPAAEVHARLDGATLFEEIALGAGINRFDVAKAGAALVDAGAARLPTPDELCSLAKARESAGDVRSALGLVRQWQTMRPLEPEPCLEAAAVAARAARHEDEAESLKAAGRVCLKLQRAEDAKVIFQKLLVKRPGDPDALDGLRQAARLLGDAAGFSTTTRSLAELALDEGDPAQASSILKELILAFPEDIPARLLRTKALAKLGDRAQAAEELEKLADLLPTPCRKKSDRDAAAYVRDTLPHLLPDHGDLLRRFREKVGDREKSNKRVLILAGFVLACSGVGFALWPKGPDQIWAQAQAAANGGDNATALALIVELAERYPDSDESVASASLKARLEGRATAPKNPDISVSARVTLAAEGAAKSFAVFPGAASISAIDALCKALRTSEGSSISMRRTVTELVRAPFGEAIRALRREALERRDTLDAAAEVASKPPTDLLAFKAQVERSEAALDKAWGEDATKGAEAARRLSGLLLEDSLLPASVDDLRALDADVRSAQRAAATRPADVRRARVEYHKRLLSEAYERARIESAKLLAHGDLDGAEAIYGKLDGLVAEVGSSPVLEPLREFVERRGISEFSRARADSMGAIRRGIAAAKAAEDAGNLEGAATTYASIVGQFPGVRFDGIFSIPVRVETVPPGAMVFVNRKEAGLSPLVVRYGFGSPTVLSVQAAGYDAASVVLKTSETKPESALRISLSPAVRWARALSGVVEAEPLGFEGDVIVCTRSGRVERLSRHTGDVVWSTDLKSLEGVRSRPTIDRGLLYVPLLDGQVLRLSLTDGVVRTSFQLRARPMGDAASIAGHVAIALDTTVAIFTDAEAPTYVTLGAAASAGVLASKGAFWVGDANGAVTRIDTSGGTRVYPTGGKKPIVGLAAGRDLVYALTGDGVLVAVDGAAAEPIRWRRADIGDTTGRPAEALDVVAVADHAGRISLFSVTDGSPRGRKDCGAEPRDGLRSIGDRIAAALVDGRIWFYDPSKDAVIVDTRLDGTARLPLVPTGDGSIVAPASGNGLVAFPAPK